MYLFPDRGVRIAIKDHSSERTVLGREVVIVVGVGPPRREMNWHWCRRSPGPKPLTGTKGEVSLTVLHAGRTGSTHTKVRLRVEVIYNFRIETLSVSKTTETPGPVKSVTRNTRG